jgi:SlyX protein
MNAIGTLTTRLDSLETRIAHQDRTIEDLNASVTEQWKTIEALRKEVERMAARLAEVERDAPGAADPPPPHY